MGNLTLQQIATGIGIIVAILTPIIGIYKAYKKNVQDKFEQINKTIEKQQNEIESEVKKPSILTALNSFKPKENTTEIKKQNQPNKKEYINPPALGS